MELYEGGEKDIRAWMRLVRKLAWNFPGLETEEALLEYRRTVLRFMADGRALCASEGGQLAGILLFSRRQNRICFLAVAPERRRQGVATCLMREALSRLDQSRCVVVTTFCREDERGKAPRALYKGLGFQEGKLVSEYGCPMQELIRQAGGANNT